MKKYEILTSDDNLCKTINKDTLHRNIKIINLMRLLNHVNENFMMSIDGEWGTGKTFFVKQMIYLCKNFQNINNCVIESNKETIETFSKKHLVVYYNAWENDNHEEPLESLIFNILNEYPKYKEKIENPEELFNTVKPILKNVIEKLTSGIITKDCFENFKSFEDLAESIVTIEEKQEALNKLLDMLMEDNERILLIVDELDRCKPDYAVKLLEVLKHFYNNSKLTIIVVTNNRQLSYTIKKYYGNDFDGYGYLNKMYDTVFTLEVEKLDNYIREYYKILYSTSLPHDTSYELFQFLKFSYRECNRYMSMYRIIENYIDYYQDKYLVESCILLPFTLILKVKNINDYNKFITGNGKTIINEFINFVARNNENYYNWLIDILGVKENENLSEKFFARYLQVFSNDKFHIKYPYFEAISMLGNSIKINDDEN